MTATAPAAHKITRLVAPIPTDRPRQRHFPRVSLMSLPHATRLPRPWRQSLRTMRRPLATALVVSGREQAGHSPSAALTPRMPWLAIPNGRRKRGFPPPPSPSPSLFNVSCPPYSAPALPSPLRPSRTRAAPRQTPLVQMLCIVAPGCVACRVCLRRWLVLSAFYGQSSSQPSSTSGSERQRLTHL